MLDHHAPAGPPAGAPTNRRPEGSAVLLRPLRVAGLVVAKTALVEALRVYVPGLVDVQATEDGEHFWLILQHDDESED